MVVHCFTGPAKTDHSQHKQVVMMSPYQGLKLLSNIAADVFFPEIHSDCKQHCVCEGRSKPRCHVLRASTCYRRLHTCCRSLTSFDEFPGMKPCASFKQGISACLQSHSVQGQQDYTQPTVPLHKQPHFPGTWASKKQMEFLNSTKTISTPCYRLVRVHLTVDIQGGHIHVDTRADQIILKFALLLFVFLLRASHMSRHTSPVLSKLHVGQIKEKCFNATFRLSMTVSIDPDPYVRH